MGGVDHFESALVQVKWLKVALFESCDNVTKAVDVDPSSVCRSGTSGSYQYDATYMSGVFANRTHALTFETEQSIKAKVGGTLGGYDDSGGRDGDALLWVLLFRALRLHDHAYGCCLSSNLSQ
ncbi:hypothetical protein HPB50_012027 [Hyalomma asiaticum]|uniref:Uncharacterized protein n=1 Tax=Hyalomma asiaticum TaxID=266040 RepID=A0ACB7SPL4_HYAAI|nr:hypothetical protein HPB50_012027 [Hyalomma asiaticum]